MENIEQTIISQYGTSPTLRQLIANMNIYVDPTNDLDTFYDFVWNVDTAQGFGLDTWGKIVNVSRILTIPQSQNMFGFSEAADPNFQPFGQAPFYFRPETQEYILGDSAYRTLVLTKAIANVCDCSVPSYNQLLTNLFAGRGRCYVHDLGSMRLQYTFEFLLEPYELAVLTQSGVLPRPAGVEMDIVQIDLSMTFGFAEAGDYQPFGYGIFATDTIVI